jgi:phage terminase large subunit-like protein
MKKLEEIYLSEKLVYNNHPVIRWMAGNLSAKSDPAGNIKPDKEESRERIDGMVILIMALGLAITQPELKPSVYESRGLLMV